MSRDINNLVAFPREGDPVAIFIMGQLAQLVATGSELTPEKYLEFLRAAELRLSQAVREDDSRYALFNSQRLEGRIDYQGELQLGGSQSLPSRRPGSRGS